MKNSEGISGKTKKVNTSGLTPWPRGVSGNPKGRPKEIDGDLKQMIHNDFIELVATFFWLPKSKLEKIAKSEKSTALQVGVANQLLSDLRRGTSMKDSIRMISLFLGEPKQVIEYHIVCPKCSKTKVLAK